MEKVQHQDSRGTSGECGECTNKAISQRPLNCKLRHRSAGKGQSAKTYCDHCSQKQNQPEIRQLSGHGNDADCEVQRPFDHHVVGVIEGYECRDTMLPSAQAHADTATIYPIWLT